MAIRPANTQFEARVVGFPTGLVGTVGVAIRDNIGGVTLPRTTVGMIEDPAGSGSYVKILVTPLNAGDYSIAWDTGAVPLTPSDIAFEDLTVTGTFVPSPALPGEILASIDDINANLDLDIVTATPDNTNLIQINVARQIRGYLSRIISTATLVGWDSPAATPEIIRLAASKLIASQLFFNESSRTSVIVDDNHYAQKLYDEGMKILNDLVGGIELIDGVVTIGLEVLEEADFFPIDDTDRAFTSGMEL